MGSSTKTKGPKPPKATMDHLKKRTPPSVSTVIYTDDDAAARVIDLERKLGAANTVGNDVLAVELEASLAEALEERDASAVMMVFRSIGRKKYNKLVDAHPPTPEQITEFQEHSLVPDPTNPDGPKIKTSEVPAYNPETFPLALIHATLIEPRIPDIDDLEEIVDGWNETEFLQLWMAAMTVCSASRVGYWGKD